MTLVTLRLDRRGASDRAARLRVGMELVAQLRAAGPRRAWPATGVRFARLASCAAVVCLMSWSSVPAVAQSVAPDEQGARTAWGDPDLMGVWDFRSLTPLQRPAAFEGKAVLSAEEAAAYERERVALLDKDRRTDDGLSTRADVANAYNEFWWDYGKELTEDHRTSLIVEPPDGRIPDLTDAARERRQVRGEARRRDAWGPEDRSVAERCILGFNAGPPVNPSAYNNNVQIFQAPGYVVVLNEMVHDARIIPLDGRAHLPNHMRQWRGDSRGHWDGDTLVVETTNFTSQTSVNGSGRQLRLVERFTRIRDDRVRYEYTVDDAESFASPWTVVIPLKQSDQPLFEYACHEGNYGMMNLMESARAVDARRAEGSSK